MAYIKFSQFPRLPSTPGSRAPIGRLFWPKPKSAVLLFLSFSLSFGYPANPKKERKHLGWRLT